MLSLFLHLKSSDTFSSIILSDGRDYHGPSDGVQGRQMGIEAPARPRAYKPVRLGLNAHIRVRLLPSASCRGQGSLLADPAVPPFHIRQLGPPRHGVLVGARQVPELPCLPKACMALRPPRRALGMVVRL